MDLLGAPYAGLHRTLERALRQFTNDPNTGPRGLFQRDACANGYRAIELVVARSAAHAELLAELVRGVERLKDDRLPEGPSRFRTKSRADCIVLWLENHDLQGYSKMRSDDQHLRYDPDGLLFLSEAPMIGGVYLGFVVARSEHEARLRMKEWATQNQTDQARDSAAVRALVEAEPLLLEVDIVRAWGTCSGCIMCGLLARVSTICWEMYNASVDAIDW